MFPVEAKNVPASELLQFRLDGKGFLVRGTRQPILEAGNLFTNEASLTVETFPVEKTWGVFPAETPLAGRTHCLFTGTEGILT